MILFHYVFLNLFNSVKLYTLSNIFAFIYIYIYICNVVGFSEVESCRVNGHSLFLSSLSLISLLLSLVSHTHSYHSIYIYAS